MTNDVLSPGETVDITVLLTPETSSVETVVSVAAAEPDLKTPTARPG